MKAYRIAVLIFVFLVFLSASPWNEVLGQRFGGHEGKGFMSSLTQEQRQAVHEKVKEMKDQGASREEILAAVVEMLEGYGIEVPEDWPGPFGFGPGPGGFWKDLTGEQREAIHEKIRELRDQGATPEEIRAAVLEMLEGYGIEVPEDWPGPFGPGHSTGGFWKDLTKEQREAVHEKIKEMRDQGATREEIRAAVIEMLEGYGIEVPEDWPGPFGPGHGRGGFWKDLTKEQREAVHEKIKELRDQGATREEIRAAVVEMLEGYGIEVPEDWPGPFGPGPGGFWHGLTDEQGQAVREMIREMRREGATREEIQAAVAEMLEGFGIDFPRDTEETSSETAAAEAYIKTQNYPNPFNPQTEIAYSLPQDSRVKLTILNIHGQKVRVLVDEYQAAGTKKVIWDGCDERGESVASGVYFYLIEAGSYSASNQMVLLK